MATHSSILAREISWTKEPRAAVHGVAKDLVTNQLHFHFVSVYTNIFLTEVE